MFVYRKSDHQLMHEFLCRLARDITRQDWCILIEMDTNKYCDARPQDMIIYNHRGLSGFAGDLCLARMREVINYTELASPGYDLIAVIGR